MRPNALRTPLAATMCSSFLVVAVACSGSSSDDVDGSVLSSDAGSDATGKADSPGIADAASGLGLASYYQAYAVLGCQKSFDCCTSPTNSDDVTIARNWQGAVTTRAGCGGVTLSTALTTDEMGLQTDIANGTIVYHPEYAQACLDAMSQLSCDHFFDNPDLYTPAPCTSMYEGKLALGTTCDISPQCPAGDGCIGPLAGPYTCQTIPHQGQPCTGYCPETLYCDESVASPICVPQLPQGAACTFPSLECQSICDATTHTCEAPFPPACEGPGTGSQDAALDADASDGGPGVPAVVDPGHLRLWLTADRGVTCASQRVTRWADQSGNGNDAFLKYSQLGPQCDVTGHALSGVNLPYFSAPLGGNVIDETLDVDLSFLASSNYTVFVVERRWADISTGVATHGNFLLGTDGPNQSQIGCTYANDALQIGYVYYNGSPQIDLDQTCNTLLGTAAPVPSSPPSPITRDLFRYDSTQGHFIFVNGNQVAANANVTPLANAGGGAIGRCLASTTASGDDGRLHGDIAEIIVYDATLTDVASAAVDSYLQMHWRL